MSDFRFALRQLAKSPAYTVVVVLTLAFGIAVNTSIFGLVNLFFLQRLPVAEANRLVLLLQRSDALKIPHGLSFPDFKDYRERFRSVRDLLAYMPTPANLSAAGKSPERAWIEVVTPEAFNTLAVPAALGRTLLPSDGEEKGAAPVVLLTYDCWQQRFGGDPGIVGRAIVLNGRTFTVVGVASQGFKSFSFSMTMSAFVPSGALDTLREGGADLLERRSAAAWRVMGKLADGAVLDDARSEAAVISAQLATEHPDQHRNAVALVIPENRARPDPIFADYVPVFAALFTGLVGLVLFIACANVANLMFARAVTRQKELTVRAALGATRTRLIRQLLVESLVLAAIAGVAGWIIAGWVGELLVRFSPQGDIPVRTDSEPLWGDYVFTSAISLLAGLASGLLPALRASRINVVQQLKDGGGGHSRRRHRMRNLLVVSQVMFSCVVLIGAGLFLQSLRRVQSVELGFRPDHLLMLSFDLSLQGYNADRGHLFHRQLLERLQALPGVTAASLTTHVPFDYTVSTRTVRPENPPPHLPEGQMMAATASVATGYTEMFGVTLRQGRTLADTDDAKSPRVAVINTEFANLCWPGQEALGKRFRPWRDGPWIEVVGIAETAKYVMLAEPPRPYFYSPLAQDFSAPLTLMVRTAGDPSSLTAAVRNVVRDLDPHLPVYNVRTMDELMGNSAFALMPLRMGATLAAIQGLLGLLLSIMGLYAVVSSGVAQRTREIGIRMALGAAHTDVQRLVIREGLRLTFLGIGLGITLALALGFGLSRVLYGLSAVDPVVFPTVVVLLIAISALACWLPARRATQVDPMIALRAE